MKYLTTVFLRKNYFNARPLLMITLFFFVMAFNPSAKKDTTHSATTDTIDQPGWEENFNGDVKPDVRESKSNWGPYTQKRALKGSPNVLFVSYDDTGLAVWSPFGGGINIPTLQRLADRGRMYSQWHITVFCSPIRSTWRTERNHHLIGNAAIMETANDFPGADDPIPEQTVTIGQILKQNGWSTFLIGEDHNVPEQDIASGVTIKQYTTQLSFDRYHGFLGGETNQWNPDLVGDNYFTETPYGSDQGYHLSKGLTDKSNYFYKKTSISRSAE